MLRQQWFALTQAPISRADGCRIRRLCHALKSFQSRTLRSSNGRVARASLTTHYFSAARCRATDRVACERGSRSQCPLLSQLRHLENPGCRSFTFAISEIDRSTKRRNRNLIPILASQQKIAPLGVMEAVNSLLNPGLKRVIMLRIGCSMLSVDRPYQHALSACCILLP